MEEEARSPFLFCELLSCAWLVMRLIVRVRLSWDGEAASGGDGGSDCDAAGSSDKAPRIPSTSLFPRLSPFGRSLSGLPPNCDSTLEIDPTAAAVAALVGAVGSARLEGAAGAGGGLRSV